MISVIVPVYNCIHTLERCVHAICAQTMKDWELLLIDDGSTDGSSGLCDRLAVQDPRIRVFHKLNGGVSSARNLGLDNARGDYVMICDSDDWAEPDWCEKLYRAAEDHPGCLIVCNYYRSADTGEAVNAAPQCSGLQLIVPKADFFSLNRQELLGIPWNKIYRREVLEQAHIRFRPNLSLGEDLIFVLDYLDAADGDAVFVNTHLYHYTVGNPASLSSKYYSDLAGIYRTLYGRIRQVLCSNPGAWEKWRQEYLRSYFYAFDRVFRNTLSAKNPASGMQKHRYNTAVFNGSEFQECRRAVLTDRRNILQQAGLRSNRYSLYWAAVAVSETVSRLRHHK